MRDDLEDGALIARTEVLRSWRWLTADWRRALISAFFFVSLTSTGLTAAIPLYFVGRILASGAEAPSEAIAVFRVMVNFAFVYLAFLFAGRSFSEKGGVGNRDLLLTTTSPASVVVGTVVADLARALIVVGPLLLLLATAFAAGLGSVVVLPVVLASFFLLVAVSVAFGYAAGFVVRLLLLSLPSRVWPLNWVLRASLLAAGLSASVLVSLVFFSPPEVYRPGGDGPLTLLFALDLRTPLTLYAEAFFVGTPLGNPGPSTAAAVVGVVTAAVFCVGATARLAPPVWYTDAVGPTEPKGTSSKRPPAALSGTKTLRMAWWLLLRGRRNLMRFTHLIAPLLLLFSVLLASVFNETLFFALGPPVLFLVGVYLSGAAFGLNALGEEGDVLHVLLTSPTPGRCFVRAHVLAGLAVGAPTVLASLAFAPFSPLVSPVYHVLLLVFGLYLSVCCAAIAVGLGLSFPRFESVHPDYDLLPPTTFASTGYLGAVFPPGVLALVLLALHTLRPDRSFVLRTVALVALVILAAVAGAVAYGSYVYSVRRFDSYRFD